jgi:hypothetical protein
MKRSHASFARLAVIEMLIIAAGIALLGLLELALTLTEPHVVALSLSPPAVF